MQKQTSTQDPKKSNITQPQRTLAHEARNQLSIVVGCADVLLNDRKNLTDERIEALLREIQNASEHLVEYFQELSQSMDETN